MIRIDNDLALLLVAAGDEQHVVERRSVVEDGVVIEGGEDVAGPELQQVNSALIHGKPQGLGPIGGKGLLQEERKMG